MITQTELKKILHYDPETGVLTRLNSGKIIDLKTRVIFVNGRRYQVAKICYLYMTGELTNKYVYHKDGNFRNNKWSNLYLAKNLGLGIQDIVSYNETTGIFTWKIARGKAKVGDIAGYKTDGYVIVHISGTNYLAHRLAFLFMTGKMPPDNLNVHHKNGIRDDNRWENLMLVTAFEAQVERLLDKIKKEIRNDKEN